MDSLNSISESYSVTAKAVTALSIATINKLISYGIDVKGVSSEMEAKSLIQNAEHTREAAEAHKSSSPTREEKLFMRLKLLAGRLGITVTEQERISEIISKIQKRISELEKQKNNNSDFNAIKSEFEAIKSQYNSLLKGDSPLLTGMDILGKSNRAVIGL